jgi:dTDP-4-dehydrorhamnose 3,5-epimerase
MALTDGATALYLCSTPYAPGHEHGVDPRDPSIGIAWPPGVPPVLSEKDAAAPTLDEALGAGQLPSYQECAGYVEKLRAARG